MKNKIGLIGSRWLWGCILIVVLSAFYCPHVNDAYLPISISIYISELPLNSKVVVLFIPATMFASTTFLVRKNKDRGLLKYTKTMEQLSSLNWEQFEILTQQYYQKKGFKVERNGGSGADGGVDLTATKRDKVWLIQCKHYKSRVGAPTVREILGVLISRNADRAIVIATGGFTKSARDFADGQPISLVSGQDLLRD